MTELAFAKSFLQTLDSRPTKISLDHVEDLRSYPARSAYILPKMPRPLAKKQKLAPGSERSISVSLKSLRNPPLDIALPSLPPNTSILDLKTSIQEQTSIPVSKLRVLYAKKPVPDSKVLKDVLGDGDRKGEGKLEFSVMVIGGAAAVMKKGEEEVEPVVAMGDSGREVLDKEEFWGDLRGFLVQRLRDEVGGERVWSVFRGAWEKENGR